MSTEHEKMIEEEYSASSIQVLEGLEAVRKRPAMYIGDIGVKGLHHLVYEVVDNSIDEALAGYCSNIEVYINEDNSITVEDDGRGIPTDFHEKEGKSALEVVLTVLHAGGKFDKDSYKVSGGLHGVGVSCVNALSNLLVAEVHRQGKVHVQKFSKGAPLGPMEITGETDSHGTIITFKPDDSIFIATEYNYEILSSRLRELAYLNKGVRLNITDKREKDENGNYRRDEFYSTDGLKEFVKFLDENRESLIDNTIYIDTERDGVPVEVAMQYNTSFSENVHSYVNNINTIEGGTHLTGFRRALTRTLKKYAETLGENADEYAGISDKLDDIAIDEDGVVMLDRTRRLPETHRHFSHVMCLYPLHLINYDTDEHKRIYENTLLHLETLGTGQWVGFSFAMSAALYAMAKKGNAAGERLTQFCRGFVGENGFHLNGDYKHYGYTRFHYRPFTLESLFGFCDALQEMLMQDHEGGIELFPAVPDEWKNRTVEFKSLRSRGGMLVSAKLINGVLARLSVESDVARAVTINGAEYALKKGKNILIGR